jgi:hypothetical protein
LQTELASLAAKSGLTVADLTALASDSQAMEQACAHINVQALDKAVNELATAIAGKGSTAQAQTDFQAASANTSVPETAVSEAFNDLNKAITDSGVTTQDLTTVADDQAAIQKDLGNLHNDGGGDGESDDTGWTSGGGTGNASPGCGSGSSTGTGSTGTTSTGTTSTGATSSFSDATTSTGTATPPLPTASAAAASDSTTTSSSGSTVGSSSSTTGTSTTTRSGHHHGHHAGSSFLVAHAKKTHTRARHG